MTACNAGLGAVPAGPAVAEQRTGSATVGVSQRPGCAVADQKCPGRRVDEPVDLLTDAAVDPTLNGGVSRGVDELVEQLGGVGSRSRSGRGRRAFRGERRIEARHQRAHLGGQSGVDAG